MQIIPPKLSREEIAGLCRHGFGSLVNLRAVRELVGTYNEIYLLDLNGEQVILRAGPLASSDVYWDDVALMRREVAITPYFAPVEELVPRILLVDFSHQLIPRDYLFQSYLEGERWSDIEAELSPEENNELWRQCGVIVKQIHSVVGERFGYPPPQRQFTAWSEAIFDRFTHIAGSLDAHPLDLPAFQAVMDLAHSQRRVIDEIQAPHLLHGDLWTFNILVKRGSSGPLISGVLDVERAWWGDPMADWLMFLLAIRREEPEWQPRLEAFDRGYGAAESSPADRLRLEVYKAMHIGTSLAWSVRQGDMGEVARAQNDLGVILEGLHSLL